MEQIKRVSFLFRLLFQCLFISIPILLLIFWVNSPAVFPQAAVPYGGGMSFIPEGIAILTPLSIGTKALGFFICLLPVGIVEIILYSLIKLFRSYERGEIFTLASVRYIKRTGWALLIGQIVINPLFQALISFVLTFHNPPHYRYAQISLHGVNAGLVLMAILTILISWIMTEACKLREEQELTI